MHVKQVSRFQRFLMENQTIILPFAILFILWLIPFFTFWLEIVMRIVFGLMFLLIILIIGLVPTAIKSVPPYASLDEFLKQLSSFGAEMEARRSTSTSQPDNQVPNTSTPSSYVSQAFQWSQRYVVKKGYEVFFKSQTTVFGKIHCGLFRLAFVEIGPQRIILLGIFNGWYPVNMNF